MRPHLILFFSLAWSLTAFDKPINIRGQYAPLMIYSLVSQSKLLHVEAMVPIHNAINIGPTIGYVRNYKDVNAVEDDTRSFNLGGRADLVFSEMGDGFSTGYYLSNLLSLGFYDVRREASAPECPGVWENNGASLIVAFLGGKQWFWDSGINTNLGLGYIVSKSVSDMAERSGCAATSNQNAPSFRSLWLDFGVGYAF